jgi:hypothetical protein
MSTPAWQPGTLYPPGSLVRRSSSPVPTAQELTNPGFELGALTGWTTEGTGWSAATTPYQGTYSARWEPTSTSGTNGIGRIFASTAAPVNPGQTINASCMVKQGAADAGDAGGRVQLTWFDSGMVQLSISDGSNVNNSDSGNWRKSSLAATAPVGAAYVKIGARCFQEELGKKVHVDNFLWDHVYADNNSEGLVFRAVQADAGYSGATEPTWPLTLGVQVVDNQVTWEAVDSAYVTWEAVPILKSGTLEPDWPEQIDAAVDDGTVRWVAVSRRVEDEKCPNTTAVVIAASKVFAVDEDIIPFCATINPLDWSTADDAGYLPFGLQAHGSNPAEALGLYRSNLVAFNSEGFQMWQVDQDPANMAILDAAPIGSTQPRAMQPVYNDLMFLSAVGVRNLSIAAGSTNLQAGSLGEPIDVLVKAQISAGTYSPISVTFPSSGQYWLIFGPQAFVFTSASAGKGTWSRYEFPESITDATLLGHDLYLRAASGAVWKFTEDEVADDVYCQGEAPVLISADEYGQVVDLAWTYDYPEFDAVTFRILRSVDGSLFAEIGSVSGDTFTYADSTVLLGHDYSYAIVARPDPAEAIDSDLSNILSVALLAVAPAPVLSIDAVVDTTAELDWTAAGTITGSTIATYQIWRSTDGVTYDLLTSVAGGVLTYDDATLEASTTYFYYVIAVATDESESPASNIVTTAVGDDPFIEDVTLLLHGNGTNGSTNIVDSSTYNHSISRGGQVQHSTAQSKFGGSSLSFDGNGDYLVMPDSDAWNFTDGDFTIECFFYANSFNPPSILNYPNLFGQRSDFGSNESFYSFISNNGTMQANFTYGYDGGGTASVAFNYAFSTATWYHYAVCREGANLRLYLDGVLKATHNIGVRSIRNSTQNMWIGALPPTFGETYWNGFIEELRITRGVARYTGASFTVPTAQFQDP